MAEEFGWTPEQVGRLTLPQVDLYVGPEPRTKRRRMSAAEYERWRAARGC